MKKFLEEKLPVYAVWLAAFIILAAIIIIRPGWGLMDDVANVYGLVPNMQKTGVFKYGWQYGVADLGWGMFRPTYPPMVYFIYLPGMILGPWVSFLVNALLAMGIVFFYSAVLAKILRLPLAMILITCAAYFYGHDLIQHPSLQEKMLLLDGALMVWLAWNRPRLGALRFWLLMVAALLFGGAVKASIVIHLAVAIVALAAALRLQLKARNFTAWAEALGLVVVFFAMVLIFAQISKHGTYTRHYGMGNVAANISSVHGPFLLLPILAALAWHLFHWRRAFENPEILIPVVGVAAFFALFLPWGIGGYIQSGIAPLFAALIVQLCTLYSGRLPRLSWIIPLVVFGLAVTVYRSYTNLTRLADLHSLVAKHGELEQKGVKELWAPCEEGSLSIERFFKEAGSTIAVRRQALDGPVNGKVFLYDQSMCPFAGRPALPPGCENPQLIEPGSFRKSYRILSCG